MQLKIALMALIGTTIVGTPAQAQWYKFPKKVIIDQQAIKSETICGIKYGKTGCRTTEFGLTLDDSDITIDFEKDSPDWLAVLGQTVSDEDPRGTLDSLYPCSADGLTKMTAGNIAPINPPVYFNFKKKATGTSYAGLNFDLKQLLLQNGVPADKIKDAEASFKSRFDNVSNKDWEMKGKFYRVNLNRATREQIRSKSATDAAAKSCGDRLRNLRDADYIYYPIYSISVIDLDTTSFISSVTDVLAIDFAAELAKDTPGANGAKIEAGLKSAVTTAFGASSGRQIRVIAWDYMSLPDDLNVPADAVDKPRAGEVAQAEALS